MFKGEIRQEINARGNSKFYIVQGGKNILVPVQKGAAEAVKRGDWILTETTDARGGSRLCIQGA